ncbi:MAG: HD domain-containing protein [Defluviitoga tunisiensis]|uniref:Metal dependent phosphohydrolase n=1 Tax=Defluviitoga tunisiensis TaxID=1006576 RepID=A0A0C7NMJ2_DEFTU|nr:HD domain-containing protein [Defluviitoga tunisiensis]MDD3600653.1 HDIG domain-containing protein [Defluviitoga tunisiensis]MDY0378974.1 HDIG domain-containing protein [Defluviitoga tunisiensis]CEP79126.1 metal dependent phosphohydrolase [Defluviitoga tunisiensis]HHV01853.1 HDIG domain-containing protein [Defluviitoga tunisiensis]HOB55218.1 HDIG domain-containing protein [Defluviitoga tunisiensis]
MNKEDALILLKQYIKTDTLISHCLAVGAIMKELAYKLNKEPEKWEITGILHDLDYEMTKNNPDIHALKTVEILDDMVDQDIKDAILAHNEKKTLQKDIEIALYSADQLSGLITAAALVRPNKDISGLSVKSLKKKYKDKAFARSVERDKINEITKLGISLDDFFELAIKGMATIENELNLNSKS